MSMIASFQNRKLLLLFLLGMLGVWSEAAMARCVRPTGLMPRFEPLDHADHAIVTSAMRVGDVIRRYDFRWLLNPVSSSCDSGGGYLAARYSSALQQVPVAGFANVFPTAVQGVGVRLSIDGTRVSGNLPLTHALRAFETLVVTGRTISLELVKTAETTGSGKIAPSGAFFHVYFDGNGSSGAFTIGQFDGSGIVVGSTTCSVHSNSRSIAVDLGSVKKSSFSGVGTRNANRDFNVELACQGVANGSFQSSIGIRLDAAQDPSNRAGVLALSQGAGSATGIGIELVRREGTAEGTVTFGNTIALGRPTAGNNTLALPLRARYIQTQAGPVGAGTANGTATFTITYN